MKANRLKISDIDGQAAYSDIKVVKVLNAGASAINAYPNPAYGTVYLTGKNKIPVKGVFKVADQSGKTVLQTFLNPVEIYIL